jgi:hypothetical protein
VARDAATGVALLAHAISFIPITIIGLALFAATPIRARRIADLERIAEGEAAGQRET